MDRPRRLRPIGRPVAIAVAMACVAVPHATQAQEIDRREQAQQALASGDYDRARTLIEGQLAQSTRDADLLRRLAAVEAADGDLDAALTAIDRAAAIAPDDLDIRLARANILFWRGNTADARAEAETIALIDPAYPELDRLQASLARAKDRDGIGLEGLFLAAGVSRIAFDASDTKRTWTNQSAALALRLGQASTATFSAEREARAASDTRISARFDRRISSGSFYLGGGFVPDADFRERWNVAAGGEAAIANGVAGFLDMRLADYDTGTIVVVEPGVRVALTPRLSAEARAINLFGGNEDYRLGASGRLSFEPESGPGLFLSLATYPDAELDGVRQLRSAGIGVSWPVAPSVTISAIGVHEDREDSYRRDSVSLVLAKRFGRR